MKKSLFCIITFIFILTSSVFAADLNFTPIGNGKFIYCNNNESIYKENLSDNANPNPKYIMNNENMGADKYSLYVSLLNHTETKNNVGNITQTGFDIEVDVMFKANEDTTISFNALGFEVPNIVSYYEKGELKRDEGSWGCMNAIADYMQRPILQLRDSIKYDYTPYSPKTITIKKGEVFWLSDIIDNYCVVPWLKPIQILSDFEIVNGNADINIAALKSTGVLKDRSNHNYNAAFGEYTRDRQYKGIANSLPYTYSNELNYTIDNNTKDGTFLPITVYNNYSVKGKTVTNWFTHLNPMEDIWSRTISAQSDMFSFYYPDASKNNYYGVNVPSAKKDKIWYFDVDHSDTTAYNTSDKSTQSYNYIPNYKLSTKKENTGFGCNLGNFGVYVNYKISINNKGKDLRYFNYNLNTTADNIVNLRDENGEYIGDYSYCKGKTESKRNDTMASVLLEPNKTTTFYIEVLLPMNNPGGMENSFVISDTKPDMSILQNEIYYKIPSPDFNGKEYYKFSGDYCLSSDDLTNWKKNILTDRTKSAFEGHYNDYKLTASKDGYIAKFDAFQNGSTYYSGMLKYFKKVYFLNNGYNITSEYQFDEFVTDVGFANDTYYVKAGKIYYSKDKQNFKELKNINQIPVSSGNGYAITVKDGKYLISENGINFYDIDYDIPPKYIDTIGNIYYYILNNEFIYSKDGLNWEKTTLNEKASSIGIIEGKVIINNSQIIDENALKEYPMVFVNNKLCKLKNNALIIDGKEYLPLRETIQKLKGTVSWNEEMQSITANYNNINLVLSNNLSNILLNGTNFENLNNIIDINDITYLDIESFAKIFNCEVSFIKELNTINVFGNTDILNESQEYQNAEIPKDGVIKTEESAVKIAQVILEAPETEFEAKFNSYTSCWEIYSNQELKMVIRKSDGMVISIY